MTALSRVAAYSAVMSRRHGTAFVIDTQPDAAGGHVVLTTGDLAAAVALHEELCPQVEHCERCAAALCEEHGLGEPAACVDDRVHCTSAWCLCPACMDAHRVDDAAEAHQDAKGAR